MFAVNLTSPTLNEHHVHKLTLGSFTLSLSLPPSVLFGWSGTSVLSGLENSFCGPHIGIHSSKHHHHRLKSTNCFLLESTLSL